MKKSRYQKLVLAVSLAAVTAFGASMPVYAASAASAADAQADGAVQPPMPPDGQPPMGPDGQPPMGPPPDGFGKGPGGPGGMKQMKPVSEFQAAKIVDGKAEALTDVTFSADQKDQNVVLVRNGGVLTLTKGTLQKTGDSSSADASNFTGQNAIVLASDSQAVLNNLVLNSDADGANAVFATGSKAKITATHLRIHTKNNSSRGLDATYNGTVEASDVDITTEGAHCAALATDRGEGTVTVHNGAFQTSGQGSPCVYSTGNISVYDSQGQATGSEIACVEGKNSIYLENTDLTGMKDHGVMLYQSFSGDAGVGEAHFEAKNSTLNNLSTGPMFYVTNTKAVAKLENTELNTKGDTIVSVGTGRWGRKGSNGGDFTLEAKNQELRGKVSVDALSRFTLNLGDGALYAGAFNADHTAKYTKSSLASKAKLILTADAHGSEGEDAAGNCKNIRSNGHNIYYDAKTAGKRGGKTYELPGGGHLQPAKA